MDELLDVKRAEYGDPVVNMQRLGEVWSWYLNHTFGITIHITGKQAAEMEALHKQSREIGCHKDDNHIDTHGYITIAQRCAEVGK